MFFLSNLVLALAKLLQLVLEVYFWIIIARAVLSWVSPDPFNPVVRFLHRVTEPVLRPIRYACRPSPRGSTCRPWSSCS